MIVLSTNLSNYVYFLFLNLILKYIYKTFEPIIALCIILDVSNVIILNGVIFDFAHNYFISHLLDDNSDLT